MLELDAALEKILSAIRPLPTETVPVPAALGRVLAAPVIAPIALPRFDNSAMDGYAVRAGDLAGASPAAPVALKLTGQVAAGKTWAGPVPPGACVRIFTGSPLPPGADAVVMQEDTRVADPAGAVQFVASVQPGENVRSQGEDVPRGAEVLKAGERVTAGTVGLLGALGVTEIVAGRQPVIGLLATGSELREPGQPLAPGQIYESNRLSLAALLTRAGAAPKLFPLAPDTLPATRAALEAAFAQCDAVVTTGGVSVGELDFVKAAFEQLGGTLDFWKVAIRPGKPFVFGRWREKFLFGLPGNPVSALVTFLLLVRPALLRWQGAARVALPSHPGILAEPLVNRGDRRHFMRVRVDAAGQVRSAGRQGSHLLSSLAQADGLVDVPPGKTLDAGSPVTVLRWEWP